MRPIHLAQLDKTRPVVVLTRDSVRPLLSSVTVAPITTRIRGLSCEVAVGVRNGLDQSAVINCDNIQTIRTDRLGRSIGVLLPDQELALLAAIVDAFDLDAAG
jgi:mRNA interferase MazF